MGDILKSDEYRSFRSVVPQRKVSVTGEIEWTIYDTGPKHVDTPVLFIPPASGTADIFYRQLLALSASGIRAIAVDHPVVWDVRKWCAALERLIKYLRLSKVHIFGASLGGFLAQKFCQLSVELHYVHSLILCNSFTDTDIFDRSSTSIAYWAMPAVILKGVVMGSFNKHVDKDINDSVEFMKNRLDSLSQEQLASRLTLNCASEYVEPQEVSKQGVKVMLMNVFDQCALSEPVIDDLSKCYPAAKRALLKSGGNFPYLSRSAEVNVYIQIHLQQYAGTAYSPYTQEFEPPTEADALGPSASDGPGPSSQATARLPVKRLDHEGHERDATQESLHSPPPRVGDRPSPSPSPPAFDRSPAAQGGATAAQGSVTKPAAEPPGEDGLTGGHLYDRHNSMMDSMKTVNLSEDDL